MINRRNYAFEYLRIIGILGIIFFHGAQILLIRQIGYSGLIIFILVSIYLSSTQNTEEHIKKYIAKRAARILVPWLFWFIVYGLLNIINDKKFLPEGLGVSSVLAGTNIILWYLPFIFLMSIVAFVYNHASEHNAFVRKYIMLLLGVLSILSLLSTPIWRPWSLSIGNPWAQWCHALPAVFIGMTLAYLHKHSSDKVRTLLYAGIIIMASIWLIMLGQYNGVGVPYVVGTILFLSAMFETGYQNSNQVLMSISNCSYGIYLIHPVVYGIEDRLGLPENAALPVMTFVLSLLIILMAKRMPIGFVQKVI
jgi:peptidoglycan/LPS O-acetylase OafA/YrhL